ncbi:Na+/H+ antiporter NhaC [Liquorilactobacillus capillatus]|uniref:Na+ H+ antiporter n=1 Tax=Liquorilactobacillus capillatus DSM 19910 TaxID=1423731 RepID=A0A0R1MBJ0_9LACO|nr:Na+/H+ antiporter NhaC [Liquorilactobacillus capillatus]KRL01643.1 Na+ H+ antiporter [Liquorilactobacillus capillatus DSM 19910]
MHTKKVSLLEAIIVLAIIILSISIGVIALKVTPSIAILFSISLIMLYSLIRRFPLTLLNQGITSGIKPGIVPIFIFILVGALIAVWIKAGIIPTLMVIGFKIISIKFFVPSVFIVCAVVGSAVGSAFTVMSTIGIAFFGIGTTLGLDPALVVGAIVSGAIFGDKMSPLSESTNLTAAVVDADLFKHIKHLMWSTIPAFICSLILFGIIGWNNHDASLGQIQSVVTILEKNFSISIWAGIPILFMFICAWKKLPAVFTILLNICISVGMIFIQEPHTSFKSLGTLIESGYVSHTGNKQIDLLLSRGGIESMMPTVALIILTLSLGGLLMQTGLIKTAMNALAQQLSSTASLISATLLASISTNIFVGEQFLSVILPGNAFKTVYQKKRLDPVVLGRALEDGGTVINYLIPWGVAGSFVAGTFGISTLAYLPFVFFSLFSPLFSFLSGLTGIGIKYLKD